MHSMKIKVKEHSLRGERKRALVLAGKQALNVQIKNICSAMPDLRTTQAIRYEYVPYVFRKYLS